MDDLIDWPEKPVEIFEGDALDYLRAVYQGRIRAEDSRMRAASIAIGYERPSLKAMALVHTEGDLAERLERAIERSQKRSQSVINQRPMLIEAEPIKDPEAPKPKSVSRSFRLLRRI
jgi:hypothetical protein